MKSVNIPIYSRDKHFNSLKYEHKYFRIVNAFFNYDMSIKDLSKVFKVDFDVVNLVIQSYLLSVIDSSYKLISLVKKQSLS